ncbi:MAG: pyridoxal phosphate-dependent aminotransferase [Bacteroidales bacterium]|nr:pyridoxal phosphate-dependent aminotransferase [Bacteroidales bacterium]
MPDISRRGQLMPNSPIRKLVPLAEKAIRKGVKVYRLNIGQPDILTSPNAIHAIQTYNVNIIDYGHSAGNESLRKKFADYYKKINIPLEYEDILITTGASEAITLTLLTCLNAGDEIIVPEPFYANYFSFATATDVEVIPVTSSIESGFALPPIEAFEKKITPRTKAIIICNPNNPTGYLYSREELEQLRDMVRKHDLFFICDEVYRDLCYDGGIFTSAMQIEGIEKNLILIDSVSKRYSATGLRVGVLASRNRDLLQTALKFCQARLCPPNIGQVAAEAALDSPPEYLEYVFNEFLERRNFVVDALNNIEGVFCPLPKGSFYVMVKLPVDDAEKFSMWMLEEFEYKKQTVMLAPGSGFYYNTSLGKQEVRIAYVLKLQDLQNAVECLQQGLESYPGRISPETTVDHAKIRLTKSI